MINNLKTATKKELELQKPRFKRFFLTLAGLSSIAMALTCANGLLAAPNHPEKKHSRIGVLSIIPNRENSTASYLLAILPFSKIHPFEKPPGFTWPGPFQGPQIVADVSLISDSPDNGRIEHLPPGFPPQLLCFVRQN